MPSQSARLPVALSLILSMALCACRDKGVDRDIVISRWIKRDTTLAFTLHRFGWRSDQYRMHTDARTSEIRWSRAELYVVDVVQTDSGRSFTGLRRLLIIHNAVPCPDLWISPEDSLVLFSYLDRDKAKPRTCYEGGDSLGAPNPARRLMAGIPDGDEFGEVAGSLDTSALLAALARDSARLNDVPIYTVHGQLCLDGVGPCVITYDD